MGLVNIKIFVLITAAVILFGCSTTPKEHSKMAFRQYSLQCIARGLQEDTQSHTNCVVDKYNAVAKERERSDAMMSKLFVDSEQSEPSIDNVGADVTGE